MATSTTTPTLTLVFLVPIPHGHANVQMAILHNLLSEPRDDLQLRLHVVGDAPLRKRVESLPTSRHASIVFHAIASDDLFQEVHMNTNSNLRGPPLSQAYRHGLGMLAVVPPLLCPKPSDHLSRFQKVVAVLEDVKPDLFLVDIILHGMGADAAKKTGVPWAVISPGPSIDTALASQPGGRGFWRYPWQATTFTYPLPLYVAPVNIVLAIMFIFYMVLHPRRRELDAVRKQVGLPGSVLATIGEGSRGNIHASLAELEYPHVPLPNTVFAGPILAPNQSGSIEAYPEIAVFLDGGRTVLINLGSMFKYNREDVTAIAGAIVAARENLRGRGGFRVIWKLPKFSDFKTLLDEHLGADRADINITEWIDPPALAVLQHPNLSVSVHHGGANSVIEATYAGVPQVILPAWLDLYTLAVRTEWLGCGIRANKGAEPGIDGAQLANALVQLLSEDGTRIRERAGEVGRMCRRERGDRRAADAILRAAKGDPILEQMR